MLGHPPKTQDRASQLLVVEQRLLSAIQRAQRSDVRGGNTKFLAEVASESDGNHTEGIKQAATHAQKANVQCQAKFVGITPARIDCLTLGTIEGEKRLHLEVADIAGEPSHPQKR